MIDASATRMPYVRERLLHHVGGIKEASVRGSDLLRYGLWAAVVGTAVRNRKEYGVPTAWLTHLLGNTVTLLLPETLSLLQRLSLRVPDQLRPVARTLDQRVRQDPHYAGYVAPLALGFIASHADYSIYHGRWAERTIGGFGLDSVPHASAAYALARLVSETITTFDRELPSSHPLARPIDWSADHVDALSAGAVAFVTLVWEASEYLAHQAELRETGRDPHEINMQWSLPDALTDSLSNVIGLLLAVRRRRQGIRQHVAAGSRGNGHDEVHIGDDRNLEYLISLIRQSYTKNSSTL